MTASWSPKQLQQLDACTELEIAVPSPDEALRRWVPIWVLLVELPGIEPGSYGMSLRLLRAQSAVSLLGSPGLANSPG